MMYDRVGGKIPRCFTPPREIREISRACSFVDLGRRGAMFPRMAGDAGIVISLDAMLWPLFPRANNNSRGRSSLDFGTCYNITNLIVSNYYCEMIVGTYQNNKYASPYFLFSTNNATEVLPGSAGNRIMSGGSRQSRNLEIYELRR